MALPATAGVETAAAAEGALLVRARSRTRWPIAGMLSGPAQSP
jgi:hypothetical protein